VFLFAAGTHMLVMYTVT